MADEQIALAREVLIDIVSHKMPLSDKGKEYMTERIELDFTLRLHFDDENNDVLFQEYSENPLLYQDVSLTIGIRTAKQLKRYLHDFKTMLRELRFASLKLSIKELEKLPAVERFLTYGKTAKEIKRNEIFAQYGLLESKEGNWNSMISEIVELEMQSIKEELTIIELSGLQRSIEALPAKERLRTNLTVPQLAYLFKMLFDLRPNIFELKTNTELYRFISDNFSTKKSPEEGISTEKLKILFNEPEQKAVGFWQKHLYTMIEQSRKISS